MSYQCGIGGGMAEIGFCPCDPHIRCDFCGVTRLVATRRTHGPAKWFMAGKPAPGWSGGRRADHTREDYCPACTDSRASAQALADRINRGDLEGLSLPANADLNSARVNAAGEVEIDINPPLQYADGRTAP
jgi:hypothetical protein